MDALNILKHVRKLLDGGWTQGVPARDKYRIAVSAHSSSATEFCLVGAFERVSGDDDTYDSAEALQARAALEKATGYMFLSLFNDDPARTKNGVLVVVDKAIELIKEENK